VLRTAFEPVLGKGTPVVEVRKNIAQQTCDQIQDALAQEGLLGPRPRFEAYR